MSRSRPSDGNGGVIGAYVPSTTLSAPGCWSAATQVQRSAYSPYGWPTVASDPSYSSVSSIIHCQQPGPTAGILDSKTGGGWSQQGDAGLASSVSKWGALSVRSVAGYRLSVVSPTPFVFGTGDFTIEAWLYQTSASGEQLILDGRPNPPGVSVEPTLKLVTGLLTWYHSGTTFIQAAGAISLNAWHFVAASRVSGSTRLYVDGAQVGSTYTDSNNYGCSAISLLGLSNLTACFLGYMGEFRVTKGVGRYSGSTMTVPTAPFPDH